MFRYSVLALFTLACLAGCGSTEDAAPPDAPPIFHAGKTPEETLEIFIEAQRAGNLDAAKATIYPADSKYKLERAVVIGTYQILGKQVLTAAEAAASTESPPRAEGDVVLEVFEEYDRGRTSTVTYYMREIHGEWRIYSLSFTM